MVATTKQRLSSLAQFLAIESVFPRSMLSRKHIMTKFVVVLKGGEGS